MTENENVENDEAPETEAEEVEEVVEAGADVAEAGEGEQPEEAEAEEPAEPVEAEEAAPAVAAAASAPIAAPPGQSTIEYMAKQAAAEAPEEASEEEGEKWVLPKKKKHWGRRIGIGVAAVVVVALIGCCTALAIDDHKRTQFVPENTVLDDATDISGMTAEEVEEVAEQHIADGTAVGMTVAVGEDLYDISTADMGVADAQGTAQAALDLYPDAFYQRWAERIGTVVFKREPASHSLITAYTVDHDRLHARVQAIADEANCWTQNAGYIYDEATDSLKPLEAKPGINVNVDETTAALEEAAQGADGTVQIIDAVADIYEPEITEVGKGIFVNTRTCRVILYDAGEVIREYPCTPGMSGYGTPRGDWTLAYKDAAPTWTNPHSEWAKDMPESIPPGPSNPLGVRALAVSCGGGIYLHGTVNVGQLGYPGSHGCVRLSNANITELYDLVEPGIPIIIR